MKLTDQTLALQYTELELRAVKTITYITQEAKRDNDEVKLIIARRYRAWLSTYHNMDSKSYGKYYICREWLENPRAAVEWLKNLYKLGLATGGLGRFYREPQSLKEFSAESVKVF